ncbi:hypothetical protein EDB19DRAFT_1612168, partial [Suillus lakei]
RTQTTHVFELYDNIVKDDEKQIACYASGVGTYVRPEGFVRVEQVLKILDMAIAHDVRRNILNAYEWLSDRYHDGDKIFLFGFSRGAYQVRALAGMIHEVGLITPGNKGQIPNGKSKDIDGAKEFQMEFSRSAGNTFHRCMVRLIPERDHTNIPDEPSRDTVSSVGVNKTKNLPSTDTCDHVCYFRQALALDERRVKFLPEYVYWG